MSWSKAFSGKVGTGPSEHATRTLSNHARPLVIAALMLGFGTVLGACSFQPVYSGSLASNPTLDIAYAKPTTRLEQVIYQELELRLGSSASPTAQLASVNVSVSYAGVGGRTAAPGLTTSAQANATATLTITRRDGVEQNPVTIVRTASAQYTTAGQVLADNSAAVEASERAAKAVAESLRLAVLAALDR